MMTMIPASSMICLFDWDRPVRRLVPVYQHTHAVVTIDPIDITDITTIIITVTVIAIAVTPPITTITVITAVTAVTPEAHPVTFLSVFAWQITSKIPFMTSNLLFRQL